MSWRPNHNRKRWPVVPIRVGFTGEQPSVVIPSCFAVLGIVDTSVRRPACLPRLPHSPSPSFYIPHSPPKQGTPFPSAPPTSHTGRSTLTTANQPIQLLQRKTIPSGSLRTSRHHLLMITTYCRKRHLLIYPASTLRHQFLLGALDQHPLDHIHHLNGLGQLVQHLQQDHPLSVALPPFLLHSLLISYLRLLSRRLLLLLLLPTSMSTGPAYPGEWSLWGSSESITAAERIQE